MNLIDALRDSRFDGLDDAATLAAGNATVNLPPDSTPYTWSGIGAKLIENGVNPAQVIEMTTSIDTLPGGTLLDKCLSSGGFNFADPLNRATITSFEVSEPDWAVSVLNAMLAIGQPTGTLWSLLGVTPPLLADITTARAQIVDQSKKTLAMGVLVNAQANDPTVSYAQWLANIAAYGVANP